MQSTMQPFLNSAAQAAGCQLGSEVAKQVLDNPQAQQVVKATTDAAVQATAAAVGTVVVAGKTAVAAGTAIAAGAVAAAPFVAAAAVVVGGSYGLYRLVSWLG